MRFNEYRISEQIKENLADMGFTRPTDIQFKCIPHIQKGEDLLAIAQTGTGKTAAFAIPVLDKIQLSRKKGAKDGIKCIVMVPTRELALQITEVFHKIGRNTKTKTFCVYGGVEQDKQIAALEKGIDVLVTTPGRMFDLVSQGYIHLDRAHTLILDEADRMLELGFYKDIQDLIRFLPKHRQTLFFSATIDKDIKKLAYSLVNNAIRIQISPKDPVSKNVQHAVAFIEMDDKRFFLERMITENAASKILVFVRTKVRAERVKSAMERVKLVTDTIHSDKDQKERERVLAAFKSGELSVLIATDVSARGIDIPNVDFVINYDLPDKPENYVHRVGRTGRGKNKGQAFSFCAAEEKQLLKDIEGYITKPIEVIKINRNDYSDTITFSEENPNDWKKLMQEEVKKPSKKGKKK
jgi:ATP-dependent RNA helicase RhlE